MRNFLSENEKQELRKAHKRAKNKKEADKIKAIVLLNDDWSYEQIAQALLLNDSTIRRYFENYQKHHGHVDRFLASQCQGTQPRLRPEQIKQLDEHLQENVYLDVKPIVDYVEKTFAIAYSARGLTKLLKRMGFVYKKPKAIPGKADKAKQEAFLAEYETLKEQKEPEDPIYFMDAAHPTHNVMPAYGWFKKEAKPTIATNTGRKRINLNGAIHAETHELIYREDATINAQSTIALFKQMEAAHLEAKHIYIICDNAKYYRAIIVREYLKKSKIKLVFLPPYAPNLNLIERFWRLLHKEIQYNKYHEKFGDFRDACFGFLNNLEPYKKQLQSLLTENFQLIGA